MQQSKIITIVASDMTNIQTLQTSLLQKLNTEKTIISGDSAAEQRAKYFKIITTYQAPFIVVVVKNWDVSSQQIKELHNSLAKCQRNNEIVAFVEIINREEKTNV